MTKLYIRSALDGAGYACAASTALVWAFPKLAKRNLDPVSRIVCGLAGFAWVLWKACESEQNTMDILTDVCNEDVVAEHIWLEDEDD